MRRALVSQVVKLIFKVELFSEKNFGMLSRDAKKLTYISIALHTLTLQIQF